MAGKLHEKAILLSLNISAYQGTKIDRAVTNDVQVQNNAESNSGKYSKKLLPYYTTTINNEMAKLRKWHDSVTLPWDKAGRNIMLGRGYLAHIKEFAVKKAKIMDMVDDFVDNHLDAEIAKDQTRLGKMWKQSDYPTKDELRNCYSIKLIPEALSNNDDFRLDLQESEVDTIKAEIEEAMKEKEEKAMKDLWTRIYEVVSHFAEILRNPDANFKQPTIDNIEKLCNMLPILNITGDYALENMAKEIKEKVTSVGAEDLRYDSITRNKTSKAVDEILQRMGMYV